jgi:hypothetical protein
MSSKPNPKGKRAWWLRRKADPILSARAKQRRKELYLVNKQNPQFLLRQREWKLAASQKRHERYQTDPEFVERERRMRRDGMLRQRVLKNLKDDPTRLQQAVYALLSIPLANQGGPK